MKGEMFKTHGSNKLLKSNFKNIRFTDIEYGIKKLFQHSKNLDIEIIIIKNNIDL